MCFLTLAPVIAVWAFTFVWMRTEAACSESGLNSFNAGLDQLLYVFVGIPTAYCVEIATCRALATRPRILRLGAVTVVLAVVVVVAFACLLGSASGTRCPAGLPSWWPEWVPAVHG